MAFIWNDESLAILRENAGILTTEQIAQLLHTNITAVREYGLSAETEPSGDGV